MDVGKFTSAIVAAIVCVILTVSVLVPIISDNGVAENVTNSSSINAMIGIIPLLVVVGIVIFVIGTFISRNKD